MCLSFSDRLHWSLRVSRSWFACGCGGLLNCFLVIVLLPSDFIVFLHLGDSAVVIVHMRVN